MKTPHILKLRANINLAGDVALAERELSHYYGRIVPIDNESTVAQELSLDLRLLLSNGRQDSFVGFLAYEPLKPLHTIVSRVGNIQEIWVKSDEVELPYATWWRSTDSEWSCAVPSMAYGELGNSGETIESLVGDLSAGTNMKRRHLKSSAAPHVHGLHRYKAKYFPRFARTLVSSVIESGDSSGPILDPFVGSGTTLVESSLLGVESLGVDIDPLSVLISRAKLELMRTSVGDLKCAIEQLGSPSGGSYKMPPVMAIKFERKGELELQSEFEETIAGWVNALGRVEDERCRRVLSVCISDGIARKFNVRMMGTGVGRFSLEVRKTGLNRLIERNLQAVVGRAEVSLGMVQAYGIDVAKASVFRGNATSLPFDSNSIGSIVTSPPYLPAASGREDYLVGKSISLTALGLMSSDEIEVARSGSIGSMKARTESASSLPTSVNDLVHWLENDELRSIKAAPTAAYYAELSRALSESLRVLRPGAISTWVIGKESVFYTFKTREILRRVHCDDIFCEIAENAGFEVVERIDVELEKKNKNARPRSKDQYFECAIVLRKCL
jgi:tRNA G10  N-methylase Trm11